MHKSQYDLTIIGGGSAGLTAAQIAQSLGIHTLLVDKERLGGDCLHTGCVPSKSLIHVAKLIKQTQQAMRFSTLHDPQPINMSAISTYIQNIIHDIGQHELETTKGVTIKFGQASFLSPRTLRLNDEEISSRAFFITTGSSPAIPPIEGLKETGYLTNENVFDLTQLPASLAIIGGGPVGVELGQALARLGVYVTLLQGPSRLLPREDQQSAAIITEVLRNEGVKIITGARALQVFRSGTQKTIIARQNKERIEITADEILLATGRQANSAGLNLEAAGVRVGTHGIEVNAHLQTSARHIFAFGDVIGGPHFFTHTAAYQAGVAIRNALLPFGQQKSDYRVVPRCVFTDPEVARVGLTEEEARQQHRHVRVVTLPWSTIDRAQTMSETVGQIKLVLEGSRDRIVGAHLVGSQAGEMINELALAIQHRLTIDAILATIHVYPTMSTGIQQTAFAAFLSSSYFRLLRTLVHLLHTIRR